MDLFDVVSPLYRVTRLFGLSPYVLFRDKTSCHYEKSNYSRFYCVFVLILFLGYHFYAIDVKISMIEINLHSITGAVDAFQIYGIAITIVIVITCNYFKQQLLIEATNKLHAVDQRLKQMDFKLNYHQTKSIITALLIFSVAFLLIMEVINCNMFISDMRIFTLTCYLLCTIPLTIIWLEELIFVVYVLLLMQRFVLINKRLRTALPSSLAKKIRVGHSIDSEKSLLVKTRFLHLELCVIGKLINSYFSLQILLVIGLAFIGFTSNAYYSFNTIVDGFDDGQFNRVPTGLVWTSAKLAELLLLSVICTTIKNEVFRTGEILFTIRDRFKNDIASKLYLFGKQIIHCNFKMTAFDFFDIDMTLFYGVVGSAATYLTILIQFDIASKQYPNSTTILR